MQSTGSFRLTIRQGPTPGKVFELVRDATTLGRDVSNDIVVNDAEVSRNHARFTAQSGGYLIEDLASTNGTFVNGQRLIGPKLLNPGDVIGLGETVLIEYGRLADAGATVIASAPQRMMAAEPPTTPPQMPEPEPIRMAEPAPMAAPPPPMPEPMMAAEPPPPPTMSEPVMGSTGSQSTMSEPAGSTSMGGPAPAPKKSNTVKYVGIGCGCLALCLCVTAIAAYALQGQILALLNGFGF